ncbi:MAG: alpha-L-fucosidase [Alistipes sp.]|nr:alpha-L-fucosidase [Alistipes sp.]
MYQSVSPTALPVEGPYEAEWSSLEKHEAVPDWMRDAKFGIYVHWGVYSVPAYGNEQYYYYMHRDSMSENFLMGGHRRHAELWGPLEEFGYHGFIPMFKAEKFDPEPWLRDLTISDGYHRSWGYVKGMKLLTDKAVIQHLIRVVANNGRLLLNLSPMADGTIPQDQQDVVQNVGVWLWSYGEAFFGHLKDHLRLHRGLSDAHFKDFVKWYLFLQSNQGKATKK